MKPTIYLIARIYAALMFVLLIAFTIALSPFYRINPTETIVHVWSVREEWTEAIADAAYIRLTGGTQADLEEIITRLLAKM